MDGCIHVVVYSFEHGKRSVYRTPTVRIQFIVFWLHEPTCRLAVLLPPSSFGCLNGRRMGMTRQTLSLMCSYLLYRYKNNFLIYLNESTAIHWGGHIPRPARSWTPTTGASACVCVWRGPLCFGSWHLDSCFPMLHPGNALQCLFLCILPIGYLAFDTSYGSE